MKEDVILVAHILWDDGVSYPITAMQENLEQKILEISSFERNGYKVEWQEPREIPDSASAEKSPCS